MNGIQTIAIGGAHSIDKFYRLAHGWGWWPDEQPSPAIKEEIERVLGGWGLEDQHCPFPCHPAQLIDTDNG